MIVLVDTREQAPYSFSRYQGVTTGPREWETTNRLFASWKAYAERNGEHPGSVRSIGQTISKRGFMADRATVHGSTQRLVRGLSLKAGNE